MESSWPSRTPRCCCRDRSADALLRRPLRRAVEAPGPDLDADLVPVQGDDLGHWSIRTPSGAAEDIAWSYRFTTDTVWAVTGLVAFYHEKVEVVLDGERLPRPSTHLA